MAFYFQFSQRDEFRIVNRGHCGGVHLEMRGHLVGFPAMNDFANSEALCLIGSLVDEELTGA